jgi:hypothetical protein
VIIGSVENAGKKDPKGYKKKRAAKLLAAVLKVAFEAIPSDPTREILSNTAGRTPSRREEGPEGLHIRPLRSSRVNVP